LGHQAVPHGAFVGCTQLSACTVACADVSCSGGRWPLLPSLSRVFAGDAACSRGLDSRSAVGTDRGTIRRDNMDMDMDMDMSLVL